MQFYSSENHGATSISTAYQLSSRRMIYLYEVIVSSTCVKSLINLWYQLLLSLTGIYFPSKIFVSGIPISFSSVTTQFLYFKSLPYQLLLLTITVSLLTGIPFNYFYPLLLPTPISYSYQLLVTGSIATCYCISYSLQYQLIL